MADEQESRTGRVAALVLAAGGGSRLGTPKALVPWDGDATLLDLAVRTAVAAGCDPVAVVLGAEAARVRRRCALDGALVIDNPQWADGMGGSLRRGLAGVADTSAAAAVVLLVDQPFVGPAAVRRLIAAWRAGADVAVATFEGQPRNPAVFDRSTWDDLRANLSGDEGAREWLRARPDAVAVACEDLADPSDIDDAAALDRARSRWAAQGGRDVPPHG